MATSFEQYKNDYIKNTIAAQKEAAAKELETAYQQNLAALDAQETKTSQQYASGRNDTQAAYEQNLRNYGEYANAAGINSGANAQARLAYGNQRQSGLSALSEGEATALQTIAQNRTNAQQTYNSDVAGLASDYAAKEYDALYQAWQDEVSREQAQAQLDQTERSYYYTMAMNEIQSGITPTSEVLSKAGMDAGTAASMAALYKAQASGSSSGSRRSSGGSGGGGENDGEDNDAITSPSQLGRMATYVYNLTNSANARGTDGNTKIATGLLTSAAKALDKYVASGSITSAENDYLYQYMSPIYSKYGIS